MADDRAKEVIALRDREKARQGTFRSLWQSVADLVFPQTFGIDTTRSPGQELMSGLFDTTAVEEAENMTSGLVSNLFPAGQQFFAIVPTQAKDDYNIKRYVHGLTEAVHEQVFNSNFLAQVSNTIHYWLVFGTGCDYSDWTSGTGLSYRDYAIGTYQCLENDRGIIDTLIITLPMSARQVVKKFGYANVGDKVREAYDLPRTREEMFSVIHMVGPREDFDRNPILRPADRMPFESLFVIEKGETIAEEGGYDEFPFAVPRYQVVYGETYGRGRGTQLLPTIRTLNRLNRDYLEMSNKWVNPPREVLETFEGQVDVTPGATNYVTQTGSIKAIEMMGSGAYPVTKDMLEYYRENIRQGLFSNAFQALTNLQGDRRTTTEIIERLKEGMKRLSKPMGRLFTELLTPMITRSTLLLIRNGIVPPPPEAIQGTPIKVEFINPLALALRDQQSRGLQYWVSAGAQMSEVFPGVTDNVAYDVAYRDLGESLGVKSTHIRPVRERDEIRKQRAEAREKQEQLAAAGVMAEGYGKTTKAPEAGSPAEALTGGA
jgi:hypothetical protein